MKAALETDTVNPTINDTPNFQFGQWNLLSDRSESSFLLIFSLVFTAHHTCDKGVISDTSFFHQYIY